MIEWVDTATEQDVQIPAPIPTTPTTGVVTWTGAPDQRRKDAAFKSAWYNHCTMQGNKSCDLVVFDVTGENAALGVEGSLAVISSEAGVRCLVVTPTSREVEDMGGMVTTDDLRLVLYDVNPATSCAVAFPAGTDEYWDIVRKTYTEHSGRCEIYIREKQGEIDV